MITTEIFSGRFRAPPCRLKTRRKEANMKPGTPLKILLALLALAAVPTGATLAAAAEITLKVSHYLPPSHGFQKDFLEPWIGWLEEKTHGEVAVEIHDATTAFGNIGRQVRMA